MKLAFEKPEPLDLFGQLVNKLTGDGGVCHVEAVLTDGTAITATPIEGLTRHTRQYDAAHWIILDLGGDADTDSLAVEWYESEISGNPDPSYDWCGCLSFKCPAIHQDPNKWFCSESVVSVLQWAMGKFTHLDPWKVDPNELYSLCIAAGLTPQ